MLRDTEHDIIEIEIARQGIILLKHIRKCLIDGLMQRTIVDHITTTDGHIGRASYWHHIITAVLVDSSRIERGRHIRHLEGGVHGLSRLTRALCQHLHTIGGIGVTVQHLHLDDIRIGNFYAQGQGPVLQQVPRMIFIDGIDWVVALHNLSPLVVTHLHMAT